MFNHKILLNNEQATKNLAETLARDLKSNNTLDSIILLQGELGAGKTFFCREIIKYFCGENTDIISPTFNILQTYQIPKPENNSLVPDCMIYHYDLYRLKSAEEIYELGFEEALNGNLVLIEWPEIIKHLLPKPLIEINLEVAFDNKRYCTMVN